MSPTVLVPDVVTASVLACGTLLVYDYLCLLDQEVSLVWFPKWSLGTILFILNRYLPFIDTFLSLRLLLGGDSPEARIGCTAKFTVVTWFIASGVLISEVILIIRTYAIWSRERYILITLCISSSITFIPALVVTELEVRSLKYIPNKFGSFSETTIAVLTGIKAYRHVRHSRRDWIAQMYRDGLYFYVYLLSISIANVLVPILAPPEFDNWLATPQRVMHSVLSTRVLLLILKQRPSVSSGSAIYSGALPSFVHPNRDPSTSESYADDQTDPHMSDIGPSAGTIPSEIEMEDRTFGRVI